MSTLGLVVIAFITGVLFWIYIGGWALRRVFRKGGSMSSDVIRNLPQDALVRVYHLASEELERRKEAV